MKKNLTSIVGALLALALIASACGGDDGASDSEQAVADAIAGQLREEGDMPESVDADCMAKAFITGLGGVEEMASAYGLTAETINAGESPDDVELPKDQALALASEAMDCGLADVMADEMAADGMFSQDDANCVVENIDQDIVRDIMAAEFMNETDAAAIEAAAEENIFSSMLEAFVECDIDPTGG